MLVFAVQKGESAMHIQMYSLIPLFGGGGFPSYFNLFSILYRVVYLCQSQSPNPSHPPPPWCPYICSLHLCFYFCFANRFICTIMSDKMLFSSSVDIFQISWLFSFNVSGLIFFFFLTWLKVRFKKERKKKGYKKKIHFSLLLRNLSRR